MSDRAAAPTRRDVLAKAALGAVIWSAPQVLLTGRASAGVPLYLQLDPVTCSSVETTNPALVPGCAPPVWPLGELLVKDAPVGWNTLMFNGVDCTNGFELMVTHPAVTVVSGHAEQMCLTSSGGLQYSCVEGTISETGASVTFDDNRGPEGCIYLNVRIELACTGSL